MDRELAARSNLLGAWRDYTSGAIPRGRSRALTVGEEFETILGAARSGESWAFGRLYSDLAPPVAKYFRLRGAAEPDDLTSEVFLAVFERLTTFTGTEAKLRSWVFTIAHHKLVDARRRARRRPWVEVSVDEVGGPDLPGGDVEAEALGALSIEYVYGLLGRLPDTQQEVLLLRIVAGLTVPEIAASLGKSTGAVKQHQRRALATLREHVERPSVTLRAG